MSIRKRVRRREVAESSSMYKLGRVLGIIFSILKHAVSVVTLLMIPVFLGWSFYLAFTLAPLAMLGRAVVMLMTCLILNIFVE